MMGVMSRRAQCHSDRAAEDAFDAALVEERGRSGAPRIEDAIAPDEVDAYLESIAAADGILDQYQAAKRQREAAARLRPGAGPTQQ